VNPVFFATPAGFRAWLEEHHQTETELLVGFHKKDSGKPSITWPESVDEALSFGWIDGVRRSLGPESYTIRFTPRKQRSFWSNVNIARAEALIAEGRMRPAGLAAFQARAGERSGVYSFEQKDEIAFPPEQERRFRDHAAAWEFFQAQPPWYRRTVTWWVISAKKPETREKRLVSLIADSAAGRVIRGLGRKPPSPAR
jgi:uncharacterized protein YdeI (YjbR/CyaY-like superfamily)